MPQILVHKEFRVQFARGKRGLRVFEPGKHGLTNEQLAHWFVQGVIAEGRAEVVKDKAVELVPPGPQADHDEFAAAMLGDPDPEGILAELVATTETTFTITPEVKIVEVETKPVAKPAPKKPVAKTTTKKAGK